MAERTVSSRDGSTFERLMERITDTAVELSSISAQLDIYTQQRTLALEKIDVLRADISELQAKVKQQSELLRLLDEKATTCCQQWESQRSINHETQSVLAGIKEWKNTFISVQKKMIQSHDEIDAQLAQFHDDTNYLSGDIQTTNNELTAIQEHLNDIDASIDEISETLTAYRLMLLTTRRIAGFVIGFVTFISILSSVGVFEMFKLYFLK